MNTPNLRACSLRLIEPLTINSLVMFMSTGIIHAHNSQYASSASGPTGVDTDEPILVIDYRTDSLLRKMLQLTDP